MDSNLSVSVKNTIYLFIGDWGRRLFSLLFISLVARYLAPELFGAYGVAQDLALLFAPIFDMGLSTFLIREAARDHTKALNFAHGAVTLRLIVVILLLPLGIIYAIWSGYSSVSIALVVTQIAWIAVDTIGRSYRRVLMALDQMIYEGILNTFTGFLRLILAIIMLWAGFGVVGVGFADVLSAVVILVISAFTFYRYIQTPFSLSVNLSEVKGWIPTLLPLVVVQFVVAIWIRVNTQILIQFHGEAEVGILAAVNRLILLIIPFATYQVVAGVPKLSRYATENTKAFTVSASNQLKWVIYVGLVMSFILWIAAEPLIHIIFGPQYLSAVSLLRILAWQPLLYGICYSLLYTLLAQNKQKMALVLSVLPISGYLGISLWLVPQWSYIGSGWATLIGFSMWLLFLMSYTVFQGTIKMSHLLPNRSDYLQVQKMLKR